MSNILVIFKKKTYLSIIKCIWPDMLCKCFKNIFPSFQVKLYSDIYFSDIFKTYLNIIKC